MNKKNLGVTIIIIIAVIAFAIFLMNLNPNNVPQDTTECIAENSELYVQLGCHACKTQEEMFGEDYEKLNTVDCFYEREKCEGITHTPTWIINGEKIADVLTIEELKELTGCN